MNHHIYEQAGRDDGGFRNVEPARVAASRGAMRVIDVREPHELSGELGHIEGAELVPLATLDRAARGWNKDEELVMVCRSGGRSARAAALLVSMGFRRVMNMTGGMIAWNEAKLPVRR